MDFLDGENTVEKMLIKHGVKDKRPVSGTLELTPLCNMNCDMCYAHLSNENQNNKEKINTEANTVEKVQVEGEENMENARIKLTVNGNEIFVKLDDNQASRELLEMLPLTLTFEDFNSTEKIAG